MIVSSINLFNSALIIGFVTSFSYSFSYHGSIINLGCKSAFRNCQRVTFTPLKADNRQLAPVQDETTQKHKINLEDDEADELVDLITEKLDDVEGLWYSDDFYGSHGREWVKVSATLIGESAAAALEAVKITGDPNVPAGCVTFKTQSWPDIGAKVPAEIQVRADPKDPNGFSWLPGELTKIAKNEIRLMCRYSLLMKSEGTFYKQIDENEGGDGENN